MPYRMSTISTAAVVASARISSLVRKRPIRTSSGMSISFVAAHTTSAARAARGNDSSSGPRNSSVRITITTTTSE